MTAPHCILQASNISRRSADGTSLVSDVSLAVHAGERWAITGPTGAGKTVLLRALSLLDPISNGDILWNGHAITDNAVPAFRSSIVYLHQRAVLTPGTVDENLQAPFALASSVERQYDRDTVLQRLTKLHQGPAFLDKSANDLSGGEAQIVAILRALQLNPSVLLLDEPTSAMDPNTTTALEALLQEWITEPETQRAYVWVSHDSSQVSRVADHHLELN